MNKYVLKRHKFWNSFFKPFFIIYSKIFMKYSYEKYDGDPKDNILVLSNHEHPIDSILLSLSFKMPIYFVTRFKKNTKNLFSRFFFYSCNPITKSKDEQDISCIKKIIEYTNEKGSIGLFPEGEIEYTDDNLKCKDNLIKLIRKLNITVVIFNFKGLIIRYPRFGNKTNNTKSQGIIRRVIKPNEYNKLNDDELKAIINESFEIYKDNDEYDITSNTRAEYLEKTLFICPECKSLNTLCSNKNKLICTSCNMMLEVNKNMRFIQNNQFYKYRRLKDLYNYQLKEISNINNINFKDSNIKLYLNNNIGKNVLLYEGDLSLDNSNLIIGDYVFDITNIKVISTILKNKLRIIYDKKTYFIIGKDRFNPLKYKLLINKIKNDKS